MTRAGAVARGTLLCALALLACKHSPSGTSKPSCGYRTDDWCKAVAGDPYRGHKNSADCRADAKCEALPYRGESAVACMIDDRCFAENCPEVGCIMRCEELDESSCGREEVCLWKGQAGDARGRERRVRRRLVLSASDPAPTASSESTPVRRSDTRTHRRASTPRSA